LRSSRRHQPTQERSELLFRRQRHGELSFSCLARGAHYGGLTFEPHRLERGYGLFGLGETDVVEVLAVAAVLNF